MINTDLVTWSLGNQAVPGDRVIYADPLKPHRQLNKAQVVALVRHFAAGFSSINGDTYLQGDVVCLHDFNSIFYPVIFQGILGAGGSFTGTNPAYTEWELAHHFQKSATKYVITSAPQMDKVLSAARSCGIMPAHVFLLDQEEMYGFVERELSPPSALECPDFVRRSACDVLRPVNHTLSVQHGSCMKLMQCGQKDWKRITGHEHVVAAPCALFSTSGTSGPPKIAIRTHANLIAESLAIQDHQPKPYKPVRLLSVPCFHAFASPLANIASIREGVTTYIMPRFKEVDFLDAVEQHQITETALVPPVIVDWLANTTPRRQKQLRSIRLVWCGGAPLDGGIQAKAMMQLFRSEARIAQVWGLTECGWVSTFHHPENDTTGSVGRVLPGYKVRMLDDQGNIVHDGRGEIIIKSGATMSGYVGDEEATCSAFTLDGWYRTGDVAEVRQGKIYIVDRKKELIKVRGWQVSPAELEGVLLQHEQIADAAVVAAVARADSGEEVPQAYVVTTAGSCLKENEVKDYMLRYLARYKVIDCRVTFCESIPKSASGKILRKMLKEQQGSGNN